MDLAAQKGIRLWVLDLASPGVLEMMRKGMAAHLTTAPMQFALFPAPDPRKLGASPWSGVVVLGRSK